MLDLGIVNQIGPRWGVGGAGGDAKFGSEGGLTNQRP